MKTYPKGTTKEQWDQYELDLKNFEAFVNGRREFADKCFGLIEKFDLKKARDIIHNELDQSLSMDAPNKPGYYRANND